ncbi:SDR family oxidoreductase [Hyphomonas sp.]|uniref:SDR family NAD(P)-dependent oxidoreductase n=1 Tax=Hyphomonas sp. TaxID=87 RepID=UPI0030FCF60C
MRNLKGRVAIVTGAASGIGRACAVALAHEGVAVLATDIDDPGAKETVDLIEKRGGKALSAHHDVTDEARWDEIMTLCETELGRPAIMVNNAGVAIGGAILEFSLADWQKQMAINMDSVFLGTRAAMRAMQESGGSIINLSSIAGLRGSAGVSAYCASKGGVRLFSKAAAVECGQLGFPIRVNSIHPGIIDTPIWQKSIARMTDTMSADQLAALSTQNGANALSADAIARGAPMGRAGQPEEIADMVVFLASDSSSYISGQELVVDGAMTA